jgi:photosystem II stability/assembly factor-like uncharacterized protein
MNRIAGAGITLFSAIAILLAALHMLASNASAGAIQSGMGPGVPPAPQFHLVDKVEGFRLERLVRALSGADSIFSGADKTRIATRYALSTGMDVVRRYLIDEVRSAGYEPSIGRFVLNIAVPDLTGTALSSAGDTVWIADTQGRIYRTTVDGGWPAFVRCGSIGHDIYDLERDPRGRLWAPCRMTGSPYGALFVSADGGASWSLRASGTDIYTLGTVSFSNEQLGMAAGSNGTVIRTADYGESWSPLDPATFGYDAFNGIAASGLMHFWLVSDAGYLYETSDFGATWHNRSLMLGRLSGIDFHGESAGVAVGSGKAFYTKDAGVTWTSVSVATEFTAVRMSDALRVVAAGTGGEIWVSEDGGATWGRFGTECSVARDVWSVASVGDGSYWLAGRDLVRHVSWNAALEDCAAVQFADTVWGENIAFRREGEKYPDRRFLLTAHYDSKSGSPYDCAPGADDNATGVAAVLECARVLREERLERSVEFVLFDGEELGLLGSRFYAAALDTGVVYEGDLNLDMIGWTPNAEAMSAVIAKRAGATPDTILADAIETAIDSFALPLETSYLLPGEPGSSDHIAFWDAGIPAVLLIEGRAGQRTPYYHTCSDQANTLSYAYLEVCTQTALGAIAILAGLVPDEQPLFALRQNYPNPFNAGTVLSYSLEAPASVEIAVYDVSGRRVALIERSSRGQGEYTRVWDGKDEGGRSLASGLYFLRLRAGEAEAVRKIVILR